jgi:hypothetical protein
MSIFRVSGKDESSDSGQWEIILQAENIQYVRDNIPTYLRSIGRPELISGMSISQLLPGAFGILHHTIERGD